MPDTATPVVALDHVSVTYQSGPPWARVNHPAANDVTLEIAAGETVGLVGESGSGKTTIGKLVLGLLGADTGRVLFDGKPLAQRRRRNADIQLVLQHPEWALNPFLKVGTSIAEPLAVAGNTTKQERQLYISGALLGWAEKRGVRIDYIQPGKPQQNAYVERFNRTVRYEWLSQYFWEDLDEVRLFATQWMHHYNHQRPHMALGGFTPKQRLAMAA